MAAIRFHPSSSTPRRPLTRHSRSYPLHYRDDSNSETSVSDSSDQGEEADVHEPQRVRAEIFTNSGAMRPGRPIERERRRIQLEGLRIREHIPQKSPGLRFAKSQEDKAHSDATGLIKMSMMRPTFMSIKDTGVVRRARRRSGQRL